jgi:hypothetical protein
MMGTKWKIEERKEKIKRRGNDEGQGEKDDKKV